ncbi:MAG: hypothetical protein ACREXS_02550 [Gammaproteobacteria bacterium]
MANYIATANLNEPNLPRSGLLEPCAAADAVDRRRFSMPSYPARLILFRWANH